MQVALNLALASLCSFLDALRNRFRRPLLTRRYDTHPYAFGLINESVCTELVFNLGDRKLSAGHPLQCGRQIAGPDAAGRTVFEFNNMRLGVPCYYLVATGTPG